MSSISAVDEHSSQVTGHEPGQQFIFAEIREHVISGASGRIVAFDNESS